MKNFSNRTRIYGTLKPRTLIFICFIFLMPFSTFGRIQYSTKKNLHTLSVENRPIKDVFEKIESLGDYLFIYSDDTEGLDKRVTLNVKNKSINEILDILFSGTNLSYSIKDRQISVISRKSKSLNPEIQKKEQKSKKVIKGVVRDEADIPMAGVTILIKGSTRGVITDVDGTFEIEAEPTDVLKLSFLGYEDMEVSVKEQKELLIQMQPKAGELEEVAVVAFARQKKSSVVSSISTINPSELKIPSSNLTTALAGRIAGIISYQRSGEPGQDNAQFFIRGITSFGQEAKKDPLILIDNIEMSSTDLARLQPDDIESFSVMKDATGAALYGSRGANGVIIVTTKQGKEGKVQIATRYETSMSAPTKQIKLADPITYMKLHNEAVRTRNPLGIVPYSDTKIANTIANTNPMVYPANDWYDLLFKDYTFNHRFNFSLSGGGKVARYYVSATFNQDNGVLKVNGRNNFNNNIDLKNYNVRSNININMTPTTEVILRVHGKFEEYTGPLDGGQAMYNKVMNTNPVMFPAVYNPDERNKFTKNILFGNAETGQYMNPYADMVKGYKDYSSSTAMFQVELKQKLDVITQGLSLRGLANTNRYSYFDLQRFYDPYYYSVASYDKYKDTYVLKSLNDGSEALNYQEGGKVVSSSFYMEGAVDYSRTFDKMHDVTGLLVFTMRHELTGNAGDLQKSLAHRNMGFAGRLTYGFDNRYLFEANFGYNGSERFAKKKRWGFFPSVGAGWILSNEKFYQESNIEKILPKVKFKATYGLVGNDAIGSSEDRFFYLSNVNLRDGNRGMGFGTDKQYYRDGVSISRYENYDIGWETAYKTNIGVELNFYRKLEIQADYFQERRTNILQDRKNVPPTMGLQSTVRTNIGEARGRGFEISMDYNHYFKNDMWLSGRANFTYATNEYKVFEELDYKDMPWRSRVGRPLSQEWGYIAERLFVDDEEVRNSPTQNFGGSIPTMGGDIKYKDMNGDGVISEADMVPIGYPKEPEIIYGFGLSWGYKGLDASVFFQGSARSSFWIDPGATSPFIDKQRALIDAYAKDHWSEDNRNVFALWPRLSEQTVSNNMQKSTWFMRDGSFLRLKQAEIGYTLPQKWTRKAYIQMLRLYMNGTNLLTFSKFKLWDPEMGANGLGYPVQRVVNVGLQINF